MGGGALVVVDATCHPRKRLHMLVLEGSGWWCWQTTTSLKNKHVCSFSRKMGGGGGECNIPPSKMSAHARSQGWHGWWCWQTTTSLKNECVCSFSREMGGGGSECNIPPLKTSAHAHSQGWRLENKPTCSFSREMGGGGGGSNMPPSKMSAHARSQWWWVVLVLANHRRKRAYREGGW